MHKRKSRIAKTAKRSRPPIFAILPGSESCDPSPFSYRQMDPLGVCKGGADDMNVCCLAIFKLERRSAVAVSVLAI